MPPKKGKSFLENRHFQVNHVQLFTLQGTITYPTKLENEHIIDSKVPQLVGDMRQFPGGYILIYPPTEDASDK